MRRNNRGQFDGKERAEGRAMAEDISRKTLANRRNLPLDYTWVKDDGSYYSDGNAMFPAEFARNEKKVATNETVGYLSNNALKLQTGLANVGARVDPAHEKFDKQNYYASEYANMPSQPVATPQGKHGEDLGKSLVTSDFWTFLESQREEQWRAAFENFKLSHVNLSKPEERRYWQTKFPELAEKKLLFHKNQAMIEARKQEISARGIQSMGDFYFVYLDQKGVFKQGNPKTMNFYLMRPEDDSLWEAAVKDGKLADFKWNNDGANKFDYTPTGLNSI